MNGKGAEEGQRGRKGNPFEKGTPFVNFFVWTCGKILGAVVKSFRSKFRTKLSNISSLPYYYATLAVVKKRNRSKGSSYVIGMGVDPPDGGVVFITQRKEFSIPSRKLPRV